jgi:hypothetical protein
MSRFYLFKSQCIYEFQANEFEVTHISKNSADGTITYYTRDEGWPMKRFGYNIYPRMAEQYFYVDI